MHFCGQLTPTATCGCEYHTRSATTERGRVPEAERLARIKEITGADSKAALIRIDTLDMGSFADRTGPGELALVHFLQMLDHVQFNAPDKAMNFPVNSQSQKRRRSAFLPVCADLLQSSNNSSSITSESSSVKESQQLTPNSS